MVLPMRQRQDRKTKRYRSDPQPNPTRLLPNRLNHNYLPSRTPRLHQGCTFPGGTILPKRSLRLVSSRRPHHQRLHTLARPSLSRQLKSYQGQCGTLVRCQAQACPSLLAYQCHLPSQVSASPSRRA